MNDKQIVEYCRNIVVSNLSQYVCQDNKIVIEIINVKDETNKTPLLNHLKGIKEVIVRGIDIIESEEGD